ncbi:MAG: radical SAM protein [Bacteroidales bacterium]|jgi:DNA repair photolyase
MTSITGCKIIYEPKGLALEYAALATNPYRGCGHGCTYCYVPTVLHMTREEFNAGAIERRNFVPLLMVDAKKYQAAGITDQVLISFTSDPYHPGKTQLTATTIQILHVHGLGVSILTKGGTRALRDIHLLDPKKDCFGTTLTSMDYRFSKQWEPDAAPSADRIAALIEFHHKGIFTWVSLEPTLDPASSIRIIQETHRYVDLYKIGKANYISESKNIDWESYVYDVIELCQDLAVKHYFKTDLQKYLPEGYYNPMRIQQHF